MSAKMTNSDKFEDVNVDDSVRVQYRDGSARVLTVMIVNDAAAPRYFTSKEGDTVFEDEVDALCIVARSPRFAASRIRSH